MGGRFWPPSSCRSANGHIESDPIRGLDNYTTMFFNDPRFWKSLFNTAYFTLLSVPVGMVLSIIVALLMNQKVKGIAVYRTIYYLPRSLARAWPWRFFGNGFLTLIREY